MQGARVPTWPRWAIFVLLFLAAAVLWGVSFGYLAETWLFPTPPFAPGETISVTYAGEPVITTHAYVGLQQRRLNGEELPLDTPMVQARSLVAPWPPQGFWDGPANWSRDRLAPQGQSNYGPDDEGLPNTWYLISDGSDAGRAHLVGYDEQSKQSVGSIGRNGRVAGTPPPDEQFMLGRPVLNRSVSTEIPRGGSRKSFFFDEDRLMEINLKTQAVRTLGTFPGAKALTSVGVVDRAMAERLAAGGAADDRSRNVSFEPETAPRLAVWSDDTVSLVDPTTDGPTENGVTSSSRVDFDLPDDVLIDQSIKLDAVTDDKIVVSYRLDPRNFTRFKVAVLAPRGTTDGVAESVYDVELTANSRVAVLEREAAVFCGSVPIPALGAFILTVGPLGGVAAGETETYVEGLRLMLKDFGVPLCVVCIASAALAWFVYRSEHSQRRANARWLAALVFALGLPGFFAYLATRRRPPMGRCAACGKNVPQDLQRCAACGAERARPRLTGVEVFA
jgi:hypothetical protein